MVLSVSLPSGFRRVREQQNASLICVHTTKPTARCPLCHRRSRRTHSRYWRTLRDLPCAEESVCLRVQVRRFFCSNPRCPRRIFAERIEQLACSYAQRTCRLKRAQTAIAQAVGSRPGGRLCHILQMLTSASSLLRLERAASLPKRKTPRVLGVDDFAFRRGHRYGTLLYDLETHAVVDLLPNRTQETLVEWLKQHSGIEIVSRDRAECYAVGIRKGAPHAQQVADRWHLVKNLGQALVRFLDTRRGVLKQVVKELTQTALPIAKDKPAVSSPQQQRLEKEKHCRRQDRLERYQEVNALFAKGWTICQIAQTLRLSRPTVRKLVQAEAFPERKVRAPRSTCLDSFKKVLRERWQAGCHNRTELFEELREQGY